MSHPWVKGTGLMLFLYQWHPWFNIHVSRCVCARVCVCMCLSVIAQVTSSGRRYDSLFYSTPSSAAWINLLEHYSHLFCEEKNNMSEYTVEWLWLMRSAMKCLLRKDMLPWTVLSYCPTSENKSSAERVTMTIASDSVACLKYSTAVRLWIPQPFLVNFACHHMPAKLLHLNS